MLVLSSASSSFCAPYANNIVLCERLKS